MRAFANYVILATFVLSRANQLSLALGLLLSLFALSSSSAAVALDLSVEKKLIQQVQPGMSASEVLNLLSSPLYRNEQESNRREVWEYRSGAVVLRSNSVERVETPLDPDREAQGGASMLAHDQVEVSLPAQKLSPLNAKGLTHGSTKDSSARPPNSDASEAEIRDIMRAIAEQGGDDSGPAGFTGMEATPPLVGQQ